MSGIGASTVVVELLDKYRNNRKIHSYIWNPDFRDNVNIFRWNLSIQRKECERVIYGDSFEESCRHSSYYCSIYDIHDDANRARVFAIYRLLYEVYLESIRTLCLFRKVFTESSISRWFFAKWSFSCASDFSHIKRGYCSGAKSMYTWSMIWFTVTIQHFLISDKYSFSTTLCRDSAILPDSPNTPEMCYALLW